MPPCKVDGAQFWRREQVLHKGRYWLTSSTFLLTAWSDFLTLDCNFPIDTRFYCQIPAGHCPNPHPVGELACEISLYFSSCSNSYA